MRPVYSSIFTLLGKRCFPINKKYKIPTVRSAIPIGVTENKPKEFKVSAPGGNERFEVSIKSFSKINGDEPTIVTVPPKIAQNPIGINKRLRGILVCPEIRLRTGKNNAVAPTFCINPEIVPTVPETTGITEFSDFPPIFIMKPATLFITPVRSNPAPRIITAIIDNTALEAKPSNKCVSGTNPVKPNITKIKIAATSIRMTSVTKRIIV